MFSCGTHINSNAANEKHSRETSFSAPTHTLANPKKTRCCEKIEKYVKSWYQKHLLRKHFKQFPSSELPRVDFFLSLSLPKWCQRQGVHAYVVIDGLNAFVGCTMLCLHAHTHTHTISVGGSFAPVFYRSCRWYSNNKCIYFETNTAHCIACIFNIKV